MRAPFNLKSSLISIAVVAIAATGAHAQFYGHEYEGTQAPIREGEQLVIPLDTEDPSYNVWRTPRDDLQEGREPGSFDPNRFPFGMSYTAVPTFFSQPFALTPADLRAANVDVAVRPSSVRDNGTAILRE